MPKDIPIKFKLLIPLVLALVCIALAFGRAWQGVFDLTLNLIFIAYTMRVENAFLIRIILLGAAAVAVGRYVFVDYSSIFPSDLHMRVFYDEKGLADSLKAV